MSVAPASLPPLVAEQARNVAAPLLRAAKLHPNAGMHVTAGASRVEPTFSSYPSLLRQAQCIIATGLAALLELITWEKAEELSEHLRPGQMNALPCEYILQFADRDRLQELDMNLRRFSARSRVALSVETSSAVT